MLSVQAMKDTFYAVLRARIAAGNAERTVVVRGAVRPGVVVVENEVPGAGTDGISPADAFCVRWTGLRVAPGGAGQLVTATCELRYATDGEYRSAAADGVSGMDRGRALAAMDAELARALDIEPRNAARVAASEVDGGGATVLTASGTRVFWGDPIFKPAVMRGERMERSAEVEVFAYGG